MKSIDRASGNKSATKSATKTIDPQTLNSHSNHCAHCQSTTKSRRRDFSEQTWTVLLVWGEIDTRTVDQPVCEPCYNDLREVLIDRTDEIESTLADHAAGVKPAAIKAGNAKPVSAPTGSKTAAGKNKKSEKRAG